MKKAKFPKLLFEVYAEKFDLVSHCLLEQRRHDLEVRHKFREFSTKVKFIYF